MSSDASDDGGSSVNSDSLANNNSSSDGDNDNNNASSLTSNEKSEYLRLDWLRKLTLLKKYLGDDESLVQEWILLNNATESEEYGILYEGKMQQYIRTKEDELSVDDNIEPTSKDLVWVLGK